jgi:putative membrane protein
MDGWGVHGFFGGGMWLLWIGLIVVLVLVVRAMSGAGSAQGGGQPRSPREILDERYARGEIDKEEYDQKRKDLGV